MRDFEGIGYFYMHLWEDFQICISIPLMFHDFHPENILIPFLHLIDSFSLSYIRWSLMKICLRFYLFIYLFIYLFS